MKIVLNLADSSSIYIFLLSLKPFFTQSLRVSLLISSVLIVLLLFVEIQI